MSFSVGTGVPDCPDDKNIVLDCFVQMPLLDPAVKHMLRLRIVVNRPVTIQDTGTVEDACPYMLIE